MIQEQPVPEQPEGQLIQEQPEETSQVESEFVNEEVELGPSQEMQLEAYKDNATLIVFSEDSQPAILQSLQSGKNPIDSVAGTAFMVHKRLQSSLEKEGEKMSEITMVLGSAHLVAELILLADAAKLYKMEEPERMEAYRHAMMKYFEEGLNNGTIDPVELQKTVEPLMTKEQREFGLQHAEKNGIIKTAPPSGFVKPPQGAVQGTGILGGQNG